MVPLFNDRAGSGVVAAMVRPVVNVVENRLAIRSVELIHRQGPRPVERHCAAERNNRIVAVRIDLNQSRVGDRTDQERRAVVCGGVSAVDGQRPLRVAVERGGVARYAGDRAGIRSINRSTLNRGAV